MMSDQAPLIKLGSSKNDTFREWTWKKTFLEKRQWRTYLFKPWLWEIRMLRGDFSGSKFELMQIGAEICIAVWLQNEKNQNMELKFTFKISQVGYALRVLEEANTNLLLEETLHVKHRTQIFSTDNMPRAWIY